MVEFQPLEYIHAHTSSTQMPYLQRCKQERLHISMASWLLLYVTSFTDVENDSRKTLLTAKGNKDISYVDCACYGVDYSPGNIMFCLLFKMNSMLVVGRAFYFCVCPSKFIKGARHVKLAEKKNNFCMTSTKLRKCPPKQAELCYVSPSILWLIVGSEPQTIQTIAKPFLYISMYVVLEIMWSCKFCGHKMKIQYKIVWSLIKYL